VCVFEENHTCMFLTDNSVTFLDSESPLFSTLAPSAEETCGKVEDPAATASRTTQQHHQQLSLHEVLRLVIGTHIMESITMGDMGANQIFVVLFCLCKMPFSFFGSVLDVNQHNYLLLCR
jgi:hypothetical protein